MVTAGAVVVSVAGLGAATLIKSPQEVAAEAEAPPASVISTPVERRVLKETVVLRGTVVPAKTIEVSPAASSEGKSIISRTTVRVGQRIRAGAVVTEVSGRPVIALTGRIPAYRDLRPGAKGPDVKQLQVALHELGYGISDTSGTYGASTQAAVKSLFEARGYEPTTEAPPPDAGTGSGASADGGDGTATPGAAGTGRTSRPHVTLKAGEVVFVPNFPARVTEVKAALGAEVKGVVLKLAVGGLAVHGTLSPADRRLVKPGMRVRIFAEEAGLEATGKITSIGRFSSGSGTGGSPGEGPGDQGDAAQGPAAEPGHPIVVKGISGLGQKFAGQDVRLTIEAASTDKPVLVVPGSAIYSIADGSTQVIKLRPDGRQQRITVRTGAIGGGFVEVRSKELAEGDNVVVGVK